MTPRRLMIPSLHPNQTPVLRPGQSSNPSVNRSGGFDRSRWSNRPVGHGVVWFKRMGDHKARPSRVGLWSFVSFWGQEHLQFPATGLRLAHHAVLSLRPDPQSPQSTTTPMYGFKKSRPMESIGSTDSGGVDPGARCTPHRGSICPKQTARVTSLTSNRR